MSYSVDALTVSPLSLVLAEEQVISSFGNTYLNLVTAVALAAAGQLLPPIAATLPLAEVNAALN